MRHLVTPNVKSGLKGAFNHLLKNENCLTKPKRREKELNVNEQTYDKKKQKYDQTSR